MTDTRIPLFENTQDIIDERLPLFDVPDQNAFSSMYPDGNIPKPKKELSYAEQVKRKLGIVGRAATIPAVGGYVGGRFGGPYGAIAGTIGLPIADIGVTGINALTGSKIPSPYEAAKNLLPFPAPETTGERTLESAVEAGTGVRGTAKAFQTLAKDSTGLPSKIYDILGTDPLRQQLASTVGGGVSSYKTETTGDPMEGLKWGFLSGLPFSLTSGRKSIGPSAKDIKLASSNLYKSAKDAGVKFKQQPFIEFNNSIRNQLEPEIGVELLEKTQQGLYKIPTGVTEAVGTSNPKTLRYLNQLKLQEGKNLDLDTLQRIRSNISSDIVSAADADARTLRTIRDGIDNFIDKADASVLKIGPMATQKAKTAAEELKKAKELWRQGSRAELLQDINQSAMIRSGRSRKDVTDLVLDNLERIRNRSDYTKTFSATERQAIDDIIQGGEGSKFFRTSERLFGNPNIQLSTLGVTPGAAQLVPENMQPYVYGLNLVPPILSKTSGAVAGNIEQRGISALEDLLKLGRPPKLHESMLANVINPALVSGRSLTGSAQGISGILGM